MNVLTKLLQVFLFNFTAGAARLTPDAQWLLLMFFSIELVLAGIWFVLRRELDYTLLVLKALTAAILGYLIREWTLLTKLLAKGFIMAGLKAGGDSITETMFTDPDRIAAFGFEVTAVIFRDAATVSILSVKAQVMALLSGIIACVVIVVYFILAIIVFLTLLEFYASTAATILLLPFGMLQRCARFAEKAIAHIFASAVRLFVVAFILSSTLPVLVTMKLDPNVPLDSLAAALTMLLGALAIGGLAWFSNKWAQGLIHGAPSLTVQDAMAFSTHVGHSVTRLTTAVLHMTDTVARLDPAHRSRQTQPSGRRTI